MDNQATVETPPTQGILDEFQDELVKAWKRLPNKGFFFLLLGAWLALFQFWGSSVLGVIHTPSLFSWMMESYGASNAEIDDSIGMLIPFVVLGLFYWKRETLLAQPLKIWLPALSILIFSMVLHVGGFMLQEPRVSIVALFVGIYGLTGLTWGWGWLVNSFFPFCLFVFSVPLANSSQVITVPLQLMVSRLVELVSHFIGIAVIREGSMLFDATHTYQFSVAAQCSGIKSLFTIFVIAVVYAFITFRSPWKRGLIVMLSFPFAVLGNLLRMLCIVFAGAAGGQQWGNNVHDSTIISLMPYVPVIVGLFLIGGWLEKWPAPEPKSKAHP